MVGDRSNWFKYTINKQMSNNNYMNMIKARALAMGGEEGRGKGHLVVDFTQTIYCTNYNKVWMLGYIPSPRRSCASIPSCKLSDISPAIEGVCRKKRKAQCYTICNKKGSYHSHIWSCNKRAIIHNSKFDSMLRHRFHSKSVLKCSVLDYRLK